MGWEDDRVALIRVARAAMSLPPLDADIDLREEALAALPEHIKDEIGYEDECYSPPPGYQDYEYSGRQWL